MPSSRGNLPVSPDPFHLSADADELLQSWLAAVVATPGLTAITDHAKARQMLLEDSLRGADGNVKIFSFLLNKVPSTLTTRRAVDRLAATVTGCW